MPDGAYVDLQGLSGGILLTNDPSKETSMCVRGASAADVAGMWGESADVPS